MPGSHRGEDAAELLARLDRAALDPGAAWSDVCDAFAALSGAVGALLIPDDADFRVSALPHSPALDPAFERYLSDGWHLRDIRAERGFPIAVERGFVTDADIIDADAMRVHPYYAELLAPAGLAWFLGLAFRVEGRVWGLAAHRSGAQGPFQPDEIAALSWLPEHLTLAARRAALVGEHRLEPIEETLASSERGVVALGPGGRVLWATERAEAMLGAAGLLGRLTLGSPDARLDERLAALTAAATTFIAAPGAAPPKPALFALGGGQALSIDAIPMPRDFQTLLTGVVALVTVHEVAEGASLAALAVARFGLTRREAELAAALAAGTSLVPAAAGLGIAPATARAHLKSIFAKTGARSQVELVALLNRLSP